MKPLHQYKDIYNPYSTNVDWEQSSLYEEDKITQNVNPVDRELADIEAEKGEIILKPDMSGIYEIKGNRHHKGGTPIKAAPNSFIFSDFKDLAIDKDTQELLKLKKGGSIGKQKNTPAEVLRRNVDIKHYNKLINNLEDDKKDVIAKRSSELMLSKYQQILGRVAFAQEEQKQFQDGVPEFSSDTAPVMDDELQEEMNEQEQYEGGGSVGNPYLPKAQRGWSRYAPAKQVGDAAKTTPNGQVVTTNTVNQIDPNLPSWFTLWTASNTQAGQTSPTGQPTVYNPAKGNQLYDDYKYWKDVAGRDFKSPEDYQSFVYSTLEQTGNTQGINEMWRNYGHTAYSATQDINGFSDGIFGARSAYLASQRPTQKPNYTITKSQPEPDPSTLKVGDLPNKEILPYDPNVKRTKEMIVDEAWLALEALKVKKYDPYRKQIKSPLVDLNNYDPQNAINRITGAANQAYRSTRGLNPYQAQATINEVYGKTLSGVADVQGQYDEKNIVVENQQNISNNQIQRGDLQTNVNFDSQYYDQSVLSNQRFDTAKSFAWNAARSLRNSNQMQLDQLYNTLAQQPIAGSTPVLDENGNQVIRNGKPLFQSQPLYDVIPGTIRTRLTGAGNIFNESNASSMLDLENKYNLLLEKSISGTLTKEQAIALNSMTRLLSAKKTQRGYKKGGFVNPYQ